MRVCTDCMLFWLDCRKNCEEWQKIKEEYPVSKEEASLRHHPMTSNEKKRLYRINDFCAKCKDFRDLPQNFKA